MLGHVPACVGLDAQASPLGSTDMVNIVDYTIIGYVYFSESIEAGDHERYKDNTKESS